MPDISNPLYLRYLQRLLDEEVMWETASEQERLDAVALFERIFPVRLPVTVTEADLPFRWAFGQSAKGPTEGYSALQTTHRSSPARSLP